MDVKALIRKQIAVNAENHHHGDVDESEYCFRTGGESCNLAPENWSRHYESDQVVKKLDTGEWVSWTYWYGGGKHGCPDEIDWIEDAFLVKCEEKEVTNIERTFTKVE